MWEQSSIVLVRGVALVMEAVLVSRVTADMVWLVPPSVSVNKMGSGADSSLDVFVSTGWHVCDFLQLLVLHLAVAARTEAMTKYEESWCTCDQQGLSIWAIALPIFLSLCVDDDYLWLTGADCPQLSAPAHGSIEGYRRETGSTVRVSCDKGYKVHPDSSSFRSCQADKQWSEADPICQRKS